VRDRYPRSTRWSENFRGTSEDFTRPLIFLQKAGLEKALEDAGLVYAFETSAVAPTMGLDLRSDARLLPLLSHSRESLLANPADYARRDRRQQTAASSCHGRADPATLRALRRLPLPTRDKNTSTHLNRNRQFSCAALSFVQSPINCDRNMRRLGPPSPCPHEPTTPLRRAGSQLTYEKWRTSWLHCGDPQCLQDIARAPYFSAGDKTSPRGYFGLGSGSLEPGGPF
jgi:hypothetical protein